MKYQDLFTSLDLGQTVAKLINILWQPKQLIFSKRYLNFHFKLLNLHFTRHIHQFQNFTSEFRFCVQYM